MQSRKRKTMRINIIQPMALLGVGLCAALVAGPMAGAGELAGSWSVVAEARGVSPYIQIPSEHPAGGPFIRTELDSTNFTAPAYAFGALGYPSYLAQEGALVVKDKPGDVNASSNESSKYKKAERFAPFGDQGPYVAVDTPDDRTAHGIGSFRFFDAGEIKVDGGFSEARSFYSEELGAMVAEATSHAMGVQGAGNLRIAKFESFVRMTLAPDQEPKVDYRLSMSGVSTGGKEAGGWSSGSDAKYASSDIVISGQGIGIGKAAQDFAEKMNDSEIPNLMKGGVFINKLRVAESGGYYRLGGAALELRYENTPRKEQFGQVMGIRFGDSALLGQFNAG